MPTFPAPKVRRTKRVATRKLASIVVMLGSRPERLPCLIVDISPDGFRVRTSFPLRRGQVVEVISNEVLDALPCRVVWVGKQGSEQEGEAGLQSIGSLSFGTSQHLER